MRLQPQDDLAEVERGGWQGGSGCNFFYDRRTLTVEYWLEGNLLISLEYREFRDEFDTEGVDLR